MLPYWLCTVPSLCHSLAASKPLRNLPEEVKARRKSKYKDWKKRVRELIEESKRKVDEEFGRKFTQNSSENKLFCRGEKGEGGVRRRHALGLGEVRTCRG